MKALEHLMTDTVLVAPCTGTNEYGEREFGPDVAVPCRYEIGPKVVRGLGAREVVSSARVFLIEHVVNVTDRLTLADGSQPTILAVSGVKSLGGVMIREVFL